MSRVLVIDDAPEVRELIAKVLARAGHEVSVAGSGEEALAWLDGHPADVALVDKNLPHMHGSEVVARARARQPELAVVLMSAHPEPFALPPERLDGYLAKPFKSLKAIEEAVTSALDSAAAARKRSELRERLSQVVADLAPGGRKRTP